MFNTLSYKGYWIHETFLATYRVRVQSRGHKIYVVKSIHAAKILITKLTRQ